LEAKTVSEHSTEQELLSKTTRMNLLFDFYEQLLTERQRTYLTYYFNDDYSLGEIAAEFAVSRQAVYDQLRRAESLLEQYEAKLGLLERYEQRQRLVRNIRQVIGELQGDVRMKIEQYLKHLEQLEQD
jgi:predicted DNA-binding protein YlxM (UPF0122 family)